MNENLPTYTGFAGHRRIAAGPLSGNVLAVRRAIQSAIEGAVLVFDDATGRVVDVDTRGFETDIEARLAAVAPVSSVPCTEVESVEPPKPKGRGRPRPGVVAREVTRLSRHWERLVAHPGGAPVALRKLVVGVRRTGSAKLLRLRGGADYTVTPKPAPAAPISGTEALVRHLQHTPPFLGDRGGELSTTRGGCH